MTEKYLQYFQVFFNYLSENITLKTKKKMSLLFLPGTVISVNLFEVIQCSTKKVKSLYQLIEVNQFEQVLINFQLMVHFLMLCLTGFVVIESNCISIIVEPYLQSRLTKELLELMKPIKSLLVYSFIVSCLLFHVYCSKYP